MKSIIITIFAIMIAGTCNAQFEGAWGMGQSKYTVKKSLLDIKSQLPYSYRSAVSISDHGNVLVLSAKLASEGLNLKMNIAFNSKDEAYKSDVYTTITFPEDMGMTTAFLVKEFSKPNSDTYKAYGKPSRVSGSTIHWNRIQDPLTRRYMKLSMTIKMSGKTLTLIAYNELL